MIPLVLQKIGITDEDLAYEFTEALLQMNKIGINISLTDLAIMYMNAQPKFRDIEITMQQAIYHESWSKKKADDSGKTD